MSIGKMKDRVTAKNKIKVDNGRGGWTYDEQTIGTYWAEVAPLSARNIIQYRQADKNTNTLIKMRYDSKITVDTVFYARGNRYDLEELIEENDYLIMMAVGEKIGEQSSI
jgi:SPP1 family predicted phage head-tail adaptor